MTRKVLFVVHAGRERALEVSRAAAQGLISRGIAVACADDDTDLLHVDGVKPANDADGCELVVVFGGDGTILRAIEIARSHDVPVLGVNLGHVGFLAEAEPEDIDAVISAIAENKLRVEERVALNVAVTDPHGNTWSSWALNEVAIEKHQRERMTELVVTIDNHRVSRFAGDGLLCSTPTGSTAYAFSAGGPVVWPEVDAFLVVPISAHALFARPLVVSPASEIEVGIEAGPVIVSADGRRNTDAATGSVVTVRRDPQTVKFARVHETPFTERLVAKFELPVKGWRNN